MKSKVYFIAVENTDKPETIRTKFARLLKESGLLDVVRRGDRAAIKIHFGEEGNTGFVRPEYVRVVIDIIAQKQAIPFLADTNTLYKGGRTNSSDHLRLAYEHGFRPIALGAQVVIPDEAHKENVAVLEINQRFIKSAKIAKVFLEADAIIGVAHFKGHMMTGFGGALKNIGMGCAAREGKLAQHCDVSPLITIERCSGCGQCAEVCPTQAIFLKNQKAYIEAEKCIGCASCIAACAQNAIDVDWNEGAGSIQEKMVEYAKTVLGPKKNKVAFFNFAIKITKECDCLAKDDPRIAADIGIFASRDPVSIDKASFDLINKKSGRDIFREAHPERDGLKQLDYAAKLGLGSLDYELIDLS